VSRLHGTVRHGRDLVGDIDSRRHAALGPQSSANLRLAQNVSSGQYDLIHTRGRHLLKAGTLLEHYRDYMTNPTFSLGIYTFANLSSVSRKPRDPLRGTRSARGRQS
jgi:hypothetical protein